MLKAEPIRVDLIGCLIIQRVGANERREREQAEGNTGELEPEAGEQKLGFHNTKEFMSESRQ